MKPSSLAELISTQIAHTLSLRGAFARGEIGIQALIDVVNEQRKARVQVFDEILDDMPTRLDIQLQRDLAMNLISVPEFRMKWNAMLGITEEDGTREGLLDRVYAAVDELEEARFTDQGCLDKLAIGVREAMDSVARHVRQDGSSAE